MRPGTLYRRLRPPQLLLLALLFAASAHSASDPTQVVGPNECGECHAAEMRAWKGSHHFKTFALMPRSRAARQIGKRMGIRRIKRESDCMSCHFTSVVDRGRSKAIAGISCESCHGPAKQWIKVHNDFGGKYTRRKDETPAHRKERMAKLAKTPMIRSDELYKLASNCYQCHTVPNERLVNVGGHTTGSDLELVSWSQGEVRHNFLHSKDGRENIEDSPQRKRILFVVGAGVDLEYSLRGVARATQKADFAIKMAWRVKRAIARLQKIQSVAPTREVADMMRAGNSAHLKLNNEKQLTEAADRVARATKRFARRDGLKLAALDQLIPKAFKGTPVE